MRKIWISLSLALIAVVLVASTTMAAPRINPKGTSFDLSLKVNWATVGAMADVNMPMGDAFSLRVVAEAGFWYLGWFEAGASVAAMFPIYHEGNFDLAFFVGPQVGFTSYWSGLYVGGVAGLAGTYKLDNEWTFAGEVAYAPAVGFWDDGLGGTVDYYGTGGYGWYALWTKDKDMTLHFGVRSVGWLPGLFIGLSF